MHRYLKAVKMIFLDEKKQRLLAHLSQRLIGELIGYPWSVVRRRPSTIFSSPEPKALGELIVYRSSRCVSVCVSVDIFKLEYLSNQWANLNDILTEPSLRWGKGCIRFWARTDRNSGVHGNR